MQPIGQMDSPLNLVAGSYLGDPTGHSDGTCVFPCVVPYSTGTSLRLSEGSSGLSIVGSQGAVGGAVRPVERL